MYQLYIWYPWEFGCWVQKGKFETIEELDKQLNNKRQITYKIEQDGGVVKYHEAPSYYWRHGMIKPNICKNTCKGVMN